MTLKAKNGFNRWVIAPLILLTLAVFAHQSGAQTYLLYAHSQQESGESWGGLFSAGADFQPVGFEGSGVTELFAGDALNTNPESLIAVQSKDLVLIGQDELGIQVGADDDLTVSTGHLVVFGSGSISWGDYSLTFSQVKCALELQPKASSSIEIYDGSVKIASAQHQPLTAATNQIAIKPSTDSAEWRLDNREDRDRDWAFGLVTAVYSELLTAAQHNWTPHPLASTVQYQALHALDPNNENTLLNLGYLFFKHDRTDEALRCFSDLIALFPHKASFQLVMGTALCDLKRYQEALPYLDLAIQLDPQMVKAYNQKALALRQLGRYDEAMSVVTASLKVKMGAEAHLSEALLCYDTGDKKKAEKIVREEVSAKSESADFWVEKGNNLIGQGYTGLALVISKSLLKLSDQTGPAYLLAAKAYLADKNDKEGGKILDEMLSHMPAYDEGYRSKAQFLVKLGKMAEALKTIDTGLQKAGRTPLLIAAKGVLLLEQGNVDEALGYLQESLKTNPEDPLVQSLLGKCLVYLGRLEEGVQALDKALELGLPPDAATYFLLGDCLVAQEDFASGKECYQKAHSLAADDSSITARLASVMGQMGEGESAHQLLEQELAKKPNDYQLRLAIAILTYLEGENGSALSLLDAIISDYPDKSSAQLAKGKVLISIGEVEEGLTLVEQFAQSASDEVSLREVGVVYLNQKMLPEALSAFERMVAVAKNPARAERKAAEILILNGDYLPAKEYLQKGLALGNLYLANSLMARMYLTQVLLHEPADIETLQSNYISSRGVDKWSDKVLDLLKGKLTTEELVQKASSPKELGEAFFWAGVNSLANQDNIHAMRYFQQTLDEGAPYGFAREMAERMQQLMSK
jgi:tetratricopeptide (TPR) repeat protein